VQVISINGIFIHSYYVLSDIPFLCQPPSYPNLRLDSTIMHIWPKCLELFDSTTYYVSSVWESRFVLPRDVRPHILSGFYSGCDYVQVIAFEHFIYCHSRWTMLRLRRLRSESRHRHSFTPHLARRSSGFLLVPLHPTYWARRNTCGAA